MDGKLWEPATEKTAIQVPEQMRVAEAAAAGVLRCLLPTEEAERRRRQVTDHARRLIGTNFGCQVKTLARFFRSRCLRAGARSLFSSSPPSWPFFCFCFLNRLIQKGTRRRTRAPSVSCSSCFRSIASSPTRSKILLGMPRLKLVSGFFYFVLFSDLA